MPKLKDVNRRYPLAVRRKATRLFGEGHAATDIARELAVTPECVRRWCKAAGVVKGVLLDPALANLAVTALEEDERLPTTKALKSAQRELEYREQLAVTSSPAEQYRAMVVANSIKMLDAAFKAPPAVRTIRDLKTLTEIVGEALNPGGKKSGSSRLAIDLNVLTSSKTPVTIEAEIVEKSVDTE